MRKSSLLALALSLLVLVFAMVAPILAQDITITIGDTVSGEITDDVYEIRYTFNGTAGDTIVAHLNAMETVQGLDPYLELLSPDGTSLFTNDDGGYGLNSVIGPITLDSDGVYTLIATRYMREDGRSTGEFELSLSYVSINPLTLNESIGTVLTGENPQTYFNYTVTSPEIVRVEAYSTTSTQQSSPYSINVTDAQGNMLNGGYVNDNGVAIVDTLLLNEPGTYLFTLSLEPSYDASTGNIQAIEGQIDVEMTLFTIVSTPTIVNETLTGTLNGGESAHYTFVANGGDLLRLSGNINMGDNPIDVTIYRSSNNVIASVGTYMENETALLVDPIRVPADGEYLMIVRQLNFNMEQPIGSSTYTITLAPSETPTLENGVEISGTVGGNTPGMYEMVYRYEGSAGTTIRITLTSTNDTYAPSINIEGTPQLENGFNGYLMNANSTVPGSFSHEVTLPVDGVYLLRINNGTPWVNDSQPTGSFTLLVEDAG